MKMLAAAATAILLAGCAGAGATPTLTPAPTQSPALTDAPSSPPTVGPTERPTPTPEPTKGPFPTELFSAIPQKPVPDDLAAELQGILDDLAQRTGVSATLMSAQGTWSGAAGKADGVRDVTINDQFSIASATKAITAAQVMQLVEAGELSLDDLAADRLPADIEFDTNGATIRDLLGHRSGIPDYVDQVDLLTDPLRVWTPAELLAAIPADRLPTGGESEYANVNFLLLTLIIEEVTGRPMAQVLRDGALDIDGVERLIYQPDEVPTEPIAIEHGRSHDQLETVGGFLPSLALTSDRGAAAMASDSVSLGNWWRAFCAGEIVSQASLDEMVPKDEWYGLGLGEFGLGIVGHFGADAGYVTLAGCMPESGIAFAVLFNDGSMSLAEGNALLGTMQRALQP